MSIFRSILDRLIYNDECEVLDSNLTDCNVGARKERNIRDNIFVIKAITNAVIKIKMKQWIFKCMTWKNVLTNSGCRIM